MEQVFNTIERLYRQDGGWLKGIPAPWRWAFCSALITGVGVHFYALANLLPNQDAILNFYTNNDVYTSGRWFLRFASALSGPQTMPYVNGLLAILALALVSVCVCGVLEIQKKCSCCLVSLCLVCFPSFSNLMPYAFTADAYMIGLLLGAAGMWLTDRLKWGWTVGGLLMALSLGTYQAYICFAMGLMALRYLFLLTDKGVTPGQLAGQLARYVLALALAAGVYYALMRLRLWMKDAQLSSYMGLNAIGTVEPARLWDNVAAAYRAFWSQGLGDVLPVHDGSCFPSKGLKALFWISLALNGALLTLRLLVNKVGFLRTGLYCLEILLLPLILNSIYLFNPESVHVLMLFSTVLLMALAIRLTEAAVDGAKPAWRGWALALRLGCVCMVLLLCWGWAIYANRGYVKLDMKLRNTTAMLNRLTARLEETPGYGRDVAVELIGNFDESYATTKYEAYSQLDGSPGFGWVRDYDAIVNDETFKAFVRDYIGVKLASPQQERLRAVLATQEFQDMPCYPAPGSIACIQGVCIIKAAHWQLP